MVTRTIEILTLNLLKTINEMEDSGWALRFILDQGPKSLVTFEMSPDAYQVTVLDAS